MKKIKKGELGYISKEKKRRSIVTSILFLIPLIILISGWIYHGTRENILTVVAIVGCLPACKSMVGLIMILMQKSMNPEEYKKAEQVRKDLVGGYELVITAYEKNTAVNAFVVCGSEIVCYTPEPKADPAFLEKHIVKILAANAVRDVHVKVLKDFKKYIQRVEQLQKGQEQYRSGIEWTPDERYPDLNRDEFIYHTLLAISL